MRYRLKYSYFMKNILFILGAIACVCAGVYVLHNTKKIPIWPKLNIDIVENSLNCISRGASGEYCEGVENGVWFGTDDGGDCTDVRFAESERGKWRASFDYGTIYGESTCAENIGQWFAPGNPNGMGRYCWCRANYFLQNDTDKCKMQTMWIYSYDYDDVSSCMANCVFSCMGNIQKNSNFRHAVFL